MTSDSPTSSSPAPKIPGGEAGDVEGKKSLKVIAKVGLAILGLLLVGGIMVMIRVNRGLAAVHPGDPSHFIRIERSTSMKSLLTTLKGQGIVQDLEVANLYAWFKGGGRSVASGTYRVGPGMSVPDLVASLRNPVHQRVRLAEGHWIARAAAWLTHERVCPSDDYLQLAARPEEFKNVVKFPLPAGGLEGYLYPDTYDLPPLFGAKNTISRQLKTFETKVYEPLGDPVNLERAVVIASLIELEVNRDEERPLVASVIENRLRRHMPLQIDASLNYAIQKMRPLSKEELKSIPGPYNLYTHQGLPPGPICSPSYKSVYAALHPADTDDLYYVALPDGHSLFAATLAEQDHNIGLRKAALRALAKKPKRPLNARFPNGFQAPGSSTR